MSALDRALFGKVQKTQMWEEKKTTKTKSNKQKAMGSELQPTLSECGGPGRKRNASPTKKKSWGPNSET